MGLHLGTMMNNIHDKGFSNKNNLIHSLLILVNSFIRLVRIAHLINVFQGAYNEVRLAVDSEITCSGQYFSMETQEKDRL